jgi:polyferredoxin
MMEYITLWFSLTLVGIIFGLFPAWILFVGTIADAVIRMRKKVPRWMFRLAGSNPKKEKINKSILPVRHLQHIPNIVGCIIIAIVVLGGFHYLALPDELNFPPKKMIIDLIIFETSFTLFFLLTIFLPSYFLGRYLRRLPTEEEQEAIPQKEASHARN